MKKKKMSLFWKLSSAWRLILLLKNIYLKIQQQTKTVAIRVRKTKKIEGNRAAPNPKIILMKRRIKNTTHLRMLTLPNQNCLKDLRMKIRAKIWSRTIMRNHTKLNKRNSTARIQGTMWKRSRLGLGRVKISIKSIIWTNYSWKRKKQGTMKSSSMTSSLHWKILHLNSTFEEIFFLFICSQFWKKLLDNYSFLFS